MNKTYTLIIGIIVFAGLSLALSMAYSTNKTTQLGNPFSATATSTAVGNTGVVHGFQKTKMYSNENLGFSSPQTLVVNVNSVNQFILSTTTADKSSFVGFYIGKTGDCYMDFCKAPVQSTEVHNGITWDFLGNPEHCDAKECSQPSALYRTRTATKDIYLAFFEYGPALDTDSIFGTVRIK